MKQTAVEWLIIRLQKFNLIKEGNIENEFFRQIELEAKEKEMTQITEAFDDGFENHYDADLYFNKKFKPDYKNQ